MITLNKEQQYAVDLAVSGKNMFLSGGGGRGKSVVVNEIEDVKQGSSILAAPTGIAALNIGGATLHRVFKLPVGGVLNLDDAQNVNGVSPMLFSRDFETLIIDEPSMMRADVMFCIDKKLQKIRGNKDPFGGVQTLLVGDFYQLPAVLTDKERAIFDRLYPTRYCFGTKTWANLNLETVILTQCMRQDDEEFVEALDAIRKGEDFADALEWINSRCVGRDVGEDTTILCTTNYSAGKTNEMRYQELPGHENYYKAYKEGEFSSYPADWQLKLKENTKVILTANNAEQGYVNGQTGWVREFEDRAIYVEIQDKWAGNRVVKVVRNTWEEYDYDGDGKKVVVGTYKQFPIKLGYSVTIHKSQSMSLPDLAVDLGRKAFEHGQTYVALSRAVSVDGLSLKRAIRSNDIIVDAEVKNFYKSVIGDVV